MFQKYVLNAFLEMVKIRSGASAFCIDDIFYTYSEFANCISKVRSELQKFERTSQNIGLAANDDLETYASIFAIWLEGCAYVPLHPNQAIERSMEIINECEIDVLLDSSEHSAFQNIKIINTKKLEFQKLNLIPKQTSEESLAYILFTSGTTGKQKGVPISRKNLGSFMQSFWETGIHINKDDRCLQCFDLTFDVSVQSFLVALTKGACAYTIPHNQIKYSYVFGLLTNHHLTFAAMAPSMIRYLRPYFEEINIPSLRYNIVTAEASPLDLIEEWAECIPNAEIFNFYGPTEATIYCSFYKFVRNGKNKEINGMLSIGFPTPGISAIIVDENENIVGKNQRGELCIAGNQLTSGYYKDDLKNKISFFEIDFNGNKTRFYRTGDSCYFDDDRAIILTGRLDHQVKIQGYRIELGEIEYHTRTFLQGKNAVAISIENTIGNTEITLLIESEPLQISELKTYLKSQMPDYMIPSKIIFIPVFPLNNSSKIDRIKLKTMI